MQAKISRHSFLKPHNSLLRLIGLLFIIVLTACSANPPEALNTAPTSRASTTAQARPLQLPSLAAGQTCPRQQARSVTERYGLALGNGPVYAAGFEPSGELPFVDPAPASSLFAGSDWNGAKVLWFIDPHYSGPVLIRGGRIDQPGDLKFDQTLPLATSIVIDTAASNESPYWRDRPSYTRFQSSGCYAYQVDGQDFSYTIVFEAKSIAQ